MRSFIRQVIRLVCKTSLLTMCVAGIAIADTRQIPDLRIFSPHEIPLDCSIYSPETLGLTDIGINAASLGLPSNFGLKLRVIRVDPEVPHTISLMDSKYDLAYRDIVFAYHISEADIQQKLNNAIERVGAHDEKILIGYKNCFGGEAAHAVQLYSPLAAVADDGAITINIDFAKTISEIYVRRKMDDSSEILVERLDDPKPAAPSGDDAAVQDSTPGGVYPWVEHFQLREMAEAEPVLVVEKSECEEDRNFFVVSTGHLVGDIQNQNEPTNEWTVVRSRMYAVNHYLGSSGQPMARRVVENSVDPTHYWCVPKREFCYKNVDFGAFDVSARKGRTESVPSSRTYNLRLGIVSAFQLMVTEHCSDTESNGAK